MKRAIIFLSLFLINNLVFAGIADFKPGSEPDGFRRIKWGTEFSTVEKDMKHIVTAPDDNELKIYTKKDDELRIGGAQLESIEYHFWKGKFCAIKIYTKDIGNWLNLKKTTFEKFGTGFPKNDSTGEWYIWDGEITVVNLIYDKTSQKGYLVLVSKEISHQMEKAIEQKAKEGAEKGF